MEIRPPSGEGIEPLKRVGQTTPILPFNFDPNRSDLEVSADATASTSSSPLDVQDLLDIDPALLSSEGDSKAGDVIRKKLGPFDPPLPQPRKPTEKENEPKK